jgi:hypothetical protein
MRTFLCAVVLVLASGCSGASGAGSSPPKDASTDAQQVGPDGGSSVNESAIDTGVCGNGPEQCSSAGGSCDGSGEVTGLGCSPGYQEVGFEIDCSTLCSEHARVYCCAPVEAGAAAPEAGPGDAEAGPADARPADGGADAAVETGGLCRDNTDCVAGDGCLDFVLPPLCGGICTTGEGCTADTDCADAGVGFVCSSFCHCAHTGGADTGTGAQCIKGCTNASDCGPAQSCSATHHCQPLGCTSDPECATNFTCQGGSCGPKPCTKDGDCTGGYCVDTPDSLGMGPGVRACSPDLGVCIQLGV